MPKNADARPPLGEPVSNPKNHMMRGHVPKEFAALERKESAYAQKHKVMPGGRMEVGGLEWNKAKNRYTTVLPYDRTRVVLDVTNEEVFEDFGADYVNANWVNGPAQDFYIACQGPKPNSYNEFWRMVWENDAHTIVMLTGLIEGGRVKCGRYWPDKEANDGEEFTTEYGFLQVQPIGKKMLGDFCEVRKFKLTLRQPHPTTLPKDRRLKLDVDVSDDTEESESSSSESEEVDEATMARRNARNGRRRHAQVFEKILKARSQDVAVTDRAAKPRRHHDHTKKKSMIVTHYKYLEWPDHGVPEDTKGIRQLVSAVDKTRRTAIERRVKQQGKPSKKEAAVGPVIVHCSAGIGRTGTFCVVHTQLWKLRAAIRANGGRAPEFKSIQIYHGVKKLRIARSGMVQQPEQYAFAYSAIIHGAEELGYKLPEEFVSAADREMVDARKRPHEPETPDVNTKPQTEAKKPTKGKSDVVVEESSDSSSSEEDSSSSESKKSSNSSDGSYSELSESL